MADIIAEVVQQLNKVIQLDGNRPDPVFTRIEGNLPDPEFTGMEGLLVHIRNQFQSRQKRLPEPVKRCLERMNVALREAENLINGARQQPEQGWCLPAYCNPDRSSKIKAWKARFKDLLKELQMWFSISSNTEQIVSSAPLLLQAVPESGFVGSGIQSDKKKLQTWLAEPRGQASVIGVHGAGGVGKTSLLKTIYNAYKKEVSGFFDVLIWFTVSRSFEIEQLQASIAKALKLSLEKTSPTEMPEILYASLKRKRFLLILDNLWSKIELDKVGVKTGDDNGSKILISSRSREVIDTMGARDCSLMIQPLSSEESLELFRRGAFTNGDAPENNLEDIAQNIASDCKGLPLVINAVAAAMRFKRTPKDWSDALNSMKKTDSSFSRNQRTRDAELYPLLRWSYNELPDPNLKICFLNCAAFLEDKEIVVETLVEMWEAEGLLKRAETEITYLMDDGRSFINKLVSRCLLECVEYIVDDDYHTVEYLKIHEALRDTAIEISGQNEDKCLFVAGKQLQSFPGTDDTRDCKRISVAHNAIQNLPDNLKCEKLSSLVLASNIRLEQVPQGFLSNVTSLKVLDLSCTSIGTLPTSVETLAELKFLNLSKCSKLVGLPEGLCKLTSLEVLNLNSCLALRSLPKKIEELKKLKHLKLDECYSLEEIPLNLFQLTSLNTLILPLMESTFAMSVEHLTSLSRLMELTAVVKLEIKSETEVDKMATWQEMRNLALEYDNDADAERDDILPQHDTLRNMGKIKKLEKFMGKMKKLQNFHLINYQGETLPNSIRELQNLKMLLLRSCYQLKELPALANTDESGGVSALAMTEGGGVSALAKTESALTEIEGVYFPMLEKLVLKNLLKLERIAAASDGWNEKAMSKLQLLVIINCPLLKKLPEGMKLPHLKELHITMCNELMQLDIGSGGFPELEILTLDEVNKLQSIAGSSGTWDETKMSGLQILEFIDCPVLKRLPLGMDKLPALKQINGELNWWQRLTWGDDQMKRRLSKLFMII